VRAKFQKFRRIEGTDTRDGLGLSIQYTLMMSTLLNPYVVALIAILLIALMTSLHTTAGNGWSLQNVDCLVQHDI